MNMRLDIALVLAAMLLAGAMFGLSRCAAPDAVLIANKSARQQEADIGAVYDRMDNAERARGVVCEPTY